MGPSMCLQVVPPELLLLLTDPIEYAAFVMSAYDPG